MEVAVRNWLAKLPVSARARIWRVLDALGPVRQRIQRGPAAGWKIFSTLKRRQNFCFGSHEPLVLQAIDENVQPGMVCLDIGAYMGYFTLAMAARTGSEGWVYGFEPNPVPARWLRRSIGTNRLDHVFAVPCAVGSAPGKTLLKVPCNTSMSHARRDTTGISRTFDVDLVSLDHWFASTPAIDNIDFIKIDVEGMELDVLTGADKLIQRFKPQIVCEVHIHPSVPYKPTEVVDWLEARGYRLESLMPRRPSPESGSVLQTIHWLEQRQRQSPRKNIFFVCHLRALPPE